MLQPILVFSAASGPIMPSSFSQSSREQEPLPKSPSLLFSLSPAHPPWRMSLACISLVRDGTSASKNPNLLHGLRTARLHSPFAAMSMETGTSLPRPGMGASSSAQQQGDQEESRVSQQGGPQESQPLPAVKLSAGDKLHNSRFTVLMQISGGGTSSTWLASDNRTGEEVALKVFSGGDYPSHLTAQRELDIIRAAQVSSAASSPPPSTSATTSNPTTSSTVDGKTDGSDPPAIVRLLGNFDYSDHSGQHLCIAMEHLGPNLYQLAESFEENGGDQESGGSRRSGLPMPVVKSVARQLLRALDTLHQGAGMMHGALQPDNVCLAGMFQSETWIGSMDSMCYSLESWGRKLLRQQPLPRPTLPQAEGSFNEQTVHTAPVRLIDFGNAQPLRVTQQQETTSVYFSNLAYSPPEVILGLQVSESSDQWQLGCLLWWLATGYELFNAQGKDEWGADTMLLAEASQLLGRIPLQMIEQSPVRAKYFKRSGRLRVEESMRLQPQPLDLVLFHQCGMKEKDATDFSSFLLPMLDCDPTRRPSAAEMLTHPFLAETSSQKTASQIWKSHAEWLTDPGSDSAAP